MKTDLKMPVSVKMLIFLLAVLGIGAVFGGGSLILDPTGEMIGMPIDVMKVQWFSDYLIPGIILLLVLGVAPLLLMWALIRRPDWRLGHKLNLCRTMHWSWMFSLYIAFALIIWILVQLYILKAIGVIHIVYLALGVAIQIFTLLPASREYYEIKG